jgi:hypothetical protein
MFKPYRQNTFGISNIKSIKNEKILIDGQPTEVQLYKAASTFAYN